MDKSNAKKMTFAPVRLCEEQDEWVTRRAGFLTYQSGSRVTKSEIIREAIDEYIARKDFRVVEGGA